MLKQQIFFLQILQLLACICTPCWSKLNQKGSVFFFCFELKTITSNDKNTFLPSGSIIYFFHYLVAAQTEAADFSNQFLFFAKKSCKCKCVNFSKDKKNNQDFQRCTFGYNVQFQFTVVNLAKTAVSKLQVTQLK